MKILRLIALSLVTMVMIPMSVNAHPCEVSGDHNRPDHPHCSNIPKPGGKGGTYSAVIGGVIAGDNGMEEWLGGRKGVGLDSLGPTTAKITFDYFRDRFPGSPDPDGETCFGVSSSLVFLNSVSVTKGRKGRAQATLWFEGFTGDMSPVPVLYAFELTGKFDGGPNADIPWPPEIVLLETKTMTMDTWLIHVEAEGDVIRSISCIIGPVKFPGSDEITIAIKRET